jgi:ubiquinone/menaquinone biosynthesis C-methylase UbiE
MAAPPRTGAFESEWRRRFERFAESYGEDHAVSGWSEAGLAARVEAFVAAYERAVPATSGRVLDLGCGPGTYGRWLSNRGNAVVGIDYSLPSLHRAALNDRFQTRRAVYAQAEAYHLPFQTGAFDLVVCIGVLQTLAAPGPALAEMTRVLKSQGVLIIDALNAVGLAAFLHTVLRVRHYPGHELVRYSPAHLRRRLHGLGYTDLTLCPVVILPARLRRLQRALGWVSMVALFAAQSFFVVGRKTREAELCAA